MNRRLLIALRLNSAIKAQSILLLFLVAFLSVSSVDLVAEQSAPSHREIMTPAATSQGTRTRPEAIPEFVTRTGAVQFDMGWALSVRKNFAEPGKALPETDVLRLSFFDDLRVDMRIAKKSRTNSGTISILGRRLEDKLSTITMTVSSTNFIVTFKHPKKSLVYRVVGDSATGVGRVTETDLSKMPPVTREPPIAPNLLEER